MHKLIVNTLQHANTNQHYVSKIDLKDAYFCIEVPQQYRKYLGICINNEYYRYKKLPMGIAVAPIMFHLEFQRRTAPIQQLF